MDNERIHKLTNAVYRVTERLNDSEPLKWRLRDKALSISDIFDRKDFLDEEREKLLSQALSEMTRFLKLASASSYVARTNFETLMREYMNIGSVILAVTAPSNENSPDENSIKSIKSVQRQSIFSAKTSPTKRQETIMNFLKSQNNVGIGEIVIHFGNSVSEKTIQRDLADLITRGFVVAVGDRRWRRYSIGQ